MPHKSPLIALLGAPAFIVDGESRPLQMSEKTLALLALLVCNADRPISRVSLASMLWPDVDEAEARTNLRRHFYKLSKALPECGTQPFILSKNTAQWNPEPGYHVDVVEFIEGAASRNFDRALAAYAGPLCAGCLEEPVLVQRERLQRQYVDMLLEQIGDARARQDHSAAIASLERLAAEDPLNESWIRDLAQTRSDAGDRAGARRELAALVARLRSELGVEPDEETSRMYSRCFELGDGGSATNLPVESDSFVGRDRAMDEVRRRLSSKTWVTLVGPGGVGKTRLAVHAARTYLRDYSDGVWFIDLSASTEWNEALRSIAAALGLANDPATAIRNYLRDRSVLLVLDNLEQLDDAAAGGIDEILSGSSATVLATSRKRIGGRLEDVYALEHLAVPAAVLPPAQALAYAGIRLFVERAVAVAPSFSLSHENVPHVVSIVSRLDGLPLAIELVAARANLLTIEGIAKRLHDLDAFRHKHRSERHQTVNAALRWSYDLLSPREQVLLQRLAVFAGPFDLPAIEAICSDDAEIPQTSVFPVLSELVEASLVITRRGEHREEQRYNLLETVRHFLRALPRSAAQSLAGAHADYYAALVDRLSPYAEGARESEYYGPIDDDYANVRAALDSARGGNYPAAVRMVAALYRYWAMRGRLREGWEDASACNEPNRLAQIDPELRGRFFQAHGILARELGENEVAERSLEGALECYRSCGNERRECDVVWAQAKLAYNTGKEERALSLYRRCIELMERYGDEHGRASAIANVGTILHHFNNLEEAEPMYQRALEEYRRLGYLRGLAYIYRQFSLMRQNQKRYDEAVDLAKHSIALSVEIGELDREADAHAVLAGALLDARRSREAFPSLIRALEILERSENALFLMLAVQALATAAQSVGESADAVRCHAFANRMRVDMTLALNHDYATDIAAQIGELRDILPKEQFAAAWAAGEAMTPSAILGAARRIAEDDSRTIRSV